MVQEEVGHGHDFSRLLLIVLAAGERLDLTGDFE